MSAEPVFIVGVQRSGTTLLAAMLAAHSHLSCGPETHFFRRLAQMDESRLCDPGAWPHAAVAFVTSISHTGFTASERKTLLAKYQIEPEGVAAHLRDRQPSVAAMLSSVTEPYMTARQKVRWVEKTPDHILHVAAIRQHFPQSPIIRVVRDPRDVALSLLKVPWGVKALAEGLLYWERTDRRSRDFFATDAQSLTVRFEDLLGDAPATLKQVCDFIGEPFDPGMLDTSSTGVEINSRRVPWKDKVSQAPDASRINAWRAVLTRRENQMAEALLGDRLEALGYTRAESFTTAGEILPGLGSAVNYTGALETLASQGVRFWRSGPTEKSAVTIYLGDPGSQEWGGPSPGDEGGGAIHTLPLLANVLRARLSGGRVYWVSSGSEGWSGYRSYMVRKLLAPFRVSGEPGSPAASHS